MKKEKTIRAYKRKTKSGKVVNVKQHTAKYDAAEEFKKMMQKKGAGDELERKLTAKELKDVESIVSENSELDPEYLAAFYPELSPHMVKEVMHAYQKKTAVPTPAARAKAEKLPKSGPNLGSDTISKEDYKAWYNWDMVDDPKNEAALRVKKALTKKMGAKGYAAYEKQMSDSWSARGYSKAYSALGKDAVADKTPKSLSGVAGESGLKVGSTVKMSEAIEGSRGKAAPVKVLAVQKASKQDADAAGVTHTAWVQRSNGDITLAFKEEDGKWKTDNTWSDMTFSKKHPYAKSLEEIGYKVSKQRNDLGAEYWSVSRNELKGSKDGAKSVRTWTSKEPEREGKALIEDAKKLKRDSRETTLSKDELSSLRKDYGFTNIKRNTDGKYSYVENDTGEKKVASAKQIRKMIAPFESHTGLSVMSAEEYKRRSKKSR